MDPYIVARDVNTIKATNERATKDQIVNFGICAKLYDKIVTRCYDRLDRDTQSCEYFQEMFLQSTKIRS